MFVGAEDADDTREATDCRPLNEIKDLTSFCVDGTSIAEP